MRNNKINCLQFASIFVSLIPASLSGLGIFAIIKAAGIDGYLSVLLGGILSIILFLIFLYIFNYEPDLPITKKTISLFGKVFGNIINIIMVAVALISCIVLIYNLNNFVVSQFLAETPHLIVGGLFVFLIFYINTKGIETMTRTYLIFVIINYLFFVITLLGLMPTFEFSNLKPILATGFERPLLGVFYVISINITPIFLLTAIPKNSLQDKEKVKKALTFAYILSVISIFIIVLMILGNFGIYLSSYYQYPEYMVLKRINFFNFLDRLENILIIQWIFNTFISSSFIVYFITNFIKYRSTNKIIIGIILAVILIASLNVFGNNTSYNSFCYYLFPYFRLAILFVFMLIGLSIKFKRKRN